VRTVRRSGTGGRGKGCGRHRSQPRRLDSTDSVFASLTWRCRDTAQPRSAATTLRWSCSGRCGRRGTTVSVLRGSHVPPGSINAEHGANRG
jgi:hypothetical protein